jgi:hypothetical protein
MSTEEFPSASSEEIVLKLLPGPDRKREEVTYGYRLTYRNPNRDAGGCRMIWEVVGGRLAYQITLEQDDRQRLHLHCTCADAIFRAEAEGRYCKHVRGLLEFGVSARELVDRLEPRARLGA